MTMTSLAESGGWTPLVDGLTQDVGLLTAAVYGVVWRYCQMEERVCTASLDTIGRHLNIDRATVQRHLKKLCAAGYLQDLTPQRRNKAHVYADTGRAQRPADSHRPPSTAPGSVAEDNVAVAEDNVAVAEGNVTVAESHLKKDLKKDSMTESNNPPGALKEISLALIELCQLDLTILDHHLLVELQETSRALAGGDYRPADVVAFGRWWSAHDWRGRRGQPPEINQVRRSWGRFRHYQLQGGNKSNHGHSYRTNIAGLREPAGETVLKKCFDPATGQTYYLDRNSPIRPAGPGPGAPFARHPAQPGQPAHDRSRPGHDRSALRLALSLRRSGQCQE
jgi:DNA-binding MarR family transcriptional regulator